jgi:hypothetical protein
MKMPITGVVPHPGATFPYSEFKGFNAVPKAVTLPVSATAVPTLPTLDVAIVFAHKLRFFLTFCNIIKDRSLARIRPDQ